MKRTLPLMLGVVCFLVANDEIPQRIKVSKTEHADLLPGSTLRLKNSTGEVTVEGWDQPVVEITTIKSTKLAYSGATPAVERDRAAHDLENVKITFSQQNGEFVVTTDFPRGAPLSAASLCRFEGLQPRIPDQGSTRFEDLRRT